MTIRLTIFDDVAYFGAIHHAHQMQLIINTALLFENNSPKLINYEKIGFCALVPIPPKVSTFRFLIIMPFDYRIWTPLVVSIAGSFIVWWLYRGRGAVDSHWLLLAEIYKLFFGQGFTLSRYNHFMLLTLMQLICWLMFVIGNAYESEITSCMIEPFNENRLESVADLLVSDYEIVTDQGFTFMLNNSDGFEALKSKIKMTDLQIIARFYAEIKQKRHVLIGMCDVLDVDLKRKFKNGLVSDHFYMLPEVILWDFVRLEAGYFNPYLERFQFYMDLSFQAGLPHMWKVFGELDRSRKSVTEESIMDSLGYEDLYQVYLVLIILHGVSVLVFFCEIFYHDCLRNIRGHQMLDCVRWVRKLFKKSKKSRQIIAVQPRN
ncbi:unnamed protein product [Chironomus riparius]|uniref:Ionotropic receptor n=1 Tax=Chironomus riparius TaxID=315576 RepID=A0A9N9WZU6_9DIPT|nr:unnamed protein product [Chironomus riparius]